MPLTELRTSRREMVVPVLYQWSTVRYYVIRASTEEKQKSRRRRRIIRLDGTEGGVEEGHVSQTRNNLGIGLVVTKKQCCFARD